MESSTCFHQHDICCSQIHTRRILALETYLSQAISMDGDGHFSPLLFCCVWSKLGPVLMELVAWWCTAQSKESVLSCVHVQMLFWSKSQSYLVGAETEAAFSCYLHRKTLMYLHLPKIPSCVIWKHMFASWRSTILLLLLCCLYIYI